MDTLRLSLDEHYCELLQLTARRSTCSRRKVAAIIVDKKGVVLSTGYNGVPSGVDHCTVSPCEGANDRPGDTSRCMAVHAEQNAIMQAGDRLTRAYTIYCSCFPCFGCAKMIANTPIKRVVFRNEYADMYGTELFKCLDVEMVHLP